jgi:hypothetical protein
MLGLESLHPVPTRRVTAASHGAFAEHAGRRGVTGAIPISRAQGVNGWINDRPSFILGRLGWK